MMQRASKKYYTVVKLEMQLDLWIVAPPGILYMMFFFVGC